MTVSKQSLDLSVTVFAMVVFGACAKNNDNIFALEILNNIVTPICTCHCSYSNRGKKRTETLNFNFENKCFVAVRNLSCIFEDLSSHFKTKGGKPFRWEKHWLKKVGKNIVCKFVIGV